MGDWDAVFDETYLRTYVPFVDEERTRTEALGAAALAGVDQGAEILDCPTGFGRHALVLTEAGYRVTGLDRSETLLAEAERRRGDAAWPRLVLGDYRELPFANETFDAAFNLYSSLGYLERDEDVGVLRELHRVLRPGGSLILETAHRDALARFFRPRGRTWDRLPNDELFLDEYEIDWIAGTISTLHLVVTPGGERIARRFLLHVYSVKEWAELLREAGFREVQAYSGWEGEAMTPEGWRLIVRAR
jgi:ubiquinone/menaquinone biosynthesis C-methylase UbiE